MKKLSYYLFFFSLQCLIACSGSDASKVNFDELDENAKRLPENAVHGMEAAEGTEVSLFAHEPMLINPTNLHVDEYGKVWVCEALNYRNSYNPENPVREEGDRILILEDTDGNGKADKRTVFYQGTDVNAALGIWAVDNRAIVSCSPHVLILTDTDGDQVADLKDTLFTGLGGLQTDHAVHSFIVGPDGKYYFNFGNTGGQILDKHGKPVIDLGGNEVNDQGNPYRQGMVFRCDPDGSRLEVLAHNFRNNYELAVDSYGTLWQSDNDDDGNRGVRINFVMEFGNYGYTDEMTGAGWRQKRVNLEKTIPLQHWHQNDPGVVPNLLQTGSGSPCGIAVYEGDQLPEVFHNQMLHAEAGHNVVRAYPVKKEGAGYSAEMIDFLKSKDQWFRPSDVCVAPDGSVFISDWYDPAVGGHKFGDPERGRIYRVSAKGAGRKYKIPPYDYKKLDGAVIAFANPNLAVRARARAVLESVGSVAAPIFQKWWLGGDSRLRARIFWLLSKDPGMRKQYFEEALKDEDEDIRIAGLRAVRQLEPDRILDVVRYLVNDPSPQVRREAAIALRWIDHPEADLLWAELAAQYDGQDRWYLEALGIGADLHADNRFAAWRNKVGEDWNTIAGKQIVWRSRAAEAMPLLKEMILDPEVEPFALRQYFRAYDFHKSAEKDQILVSLLQAKHPMQDSINHYVLFQIDPAYVKKEPKVKATLASILPTLQGTDAYLEMVGKLKLRDQNKTLLKMALESEQPGLQRQSARLLAAQGGLPLLLQEIQGADEEKVLFLLKAMGSINDKELFPFYFSYLTDEKQSMAIRRAAINSLSGNWDGQIYLMDRVEKASLPPALKTQALLALSRAWNTDIRQKARAILEKQQAEQGVELPPLAILENRHGDISKGKKMFDQYCAICHQVGKEGIQFGPALTEIGSKLSRKGLYEAIIYPSSGINFGFEGFNIQLQDGTSLQGIIESKTDAEVILRMIEWNDPYIGHF